MNPDMINTKVEMSDEEGVQNGPDAGIEFQKQQSVQPSLVKALQHQCSNGSNYRTITPYRPTIDDRITHPKKDQGTKRIKGWFAGKKDYNYNDHITSAFAELVELSRQARRELVMVTCTFNNEANQWLRNVDENEQGRTMVQAFTRSLMQKGKGWTTDSIVVLEECRETLVLEQGERKRLHVHILTYVSDNQIERLRRLLKPFSMQTQVKDYWVSKRLYNQFDELEEDQFGEMPSGQVDSDANHWLNTYKTTDNQGRCWVHIEYPVCLRSADYLSKTLNKPIGRGRNFKLIGLKGTQQRRKELYEAGRDLAVQRREESLPVY